MGGFSRDGERLITNRAALDHFDPTSGRVTIWDWTVGTAIRSFRPAAAVDVSSGVGRVVASPVGGLIAIPGSGQAIEVWDSAAGERVATLAHTGLVLNLTFSPDGSRLASASTDGAVRLWDIRTGEQLLTLRGHRVAVTAVAFSPDGSRLVSAGADGTVRVWALDLEDLVEIAERELTRGLTDAECRQYLHVQTCP